MTRLQYPIQVHFDYDINQVFKTHALFLYNDLKNNKYTYKFIVPEYTTVHDGQLLREVESQNTTWYREISKESMLPHSRSGLHRKHHLNALRRLVIGNDKRFEFANYRYKWDWHYRKFIFKRLTEGYEHMGREVPFNTLVRNYFIKKGLVKGKVEVVEVPF